MKWIKHDNDKPNTLVCVKQNNNIHYTIWNLEYMNEVRGVYVKPTDHHPELTIRLVRALIRYLPTVIDVTDSWHIFSYLVTFLPLSLLFHRYSFLLLSFDPFLVNRRKPEPETQWFPNRFVFGTEITRLNKYVS